LRNLWGLIFHPYITLRAIRAEKDSSQTFFILGFPFYLWLPVAFVLLVFELVNFFFLKISWSYHRFVLTFFAMITLLLLALEAYIAYWVFVYFKLKKKYEKA
jgi:uncharacterized membrane protein